jgi:hypothetical protein
MRDLMRNTFRESAGQEKRNARQWLAQNDAAWLAENES